MANNQQPAGGNSMAAMLGNLQNTSWPRPQQPLANYGGGLQPSMMGGAMGPQNPNMQTTGLWRGPVPGSQQPTMQPGVTGNVYNMPGQTPYQFGGGGTPQQPMQGAGGGFTPRDTGGPMQSMGGAANTMAGLLGGAGGGPQKPMPSFGAPAGGAAGGKGAAAQNPQLKQAIAGLPGGPPMGGMGRRIGAMMQRPQRPRPQGMQPPNPLMVTR